MTTIDELLKRNLKKDPILLINKSLNKYRNSNIPQEKIEKVKILIQKNQSFVCTFRPIGKARHKAKPLSQPFWTNEIN